MFPKDFHVNLADLTFVGAELARPESVLAEPDGTLWCSDARGAVTQIAPGGKQTLLGAQGHEPNGLAMSADRQTLYVANIGDGRVYRLDRDGNEQVLLDGVDRLSPLGAANFVYVDSHDRLWLSVSSRRLPWWPAVQQARPDGYLVRVDARGATIVADGLYFPNEVRMNHDESYLYAAETMMRRIVRYPVLADGALGAQEVVAPGDLGHGAYVDGFAFDVEGNLWVTLILRNEIVVVTPEGEVHTVLSDINQAAVDTVVAKVADGSLTPAEMIACAGPSLQLPTSIAFGGADLRTIYVGSLGMQRLPTFRSPIPGLPMRHWS
ncbi:MAG TPA: SMP-30/gluconolactonase/LRE family protein [Chloroflexi bacterium]|nr:SMP-30/gluconolactonase/LRE family protein [Chloroflexota bacterium]